MDAEGIKACAKILIWLLKALLVGLYILVAVWESEEETMLKRYKEEKMAVRHMSVSFKPLQDYAAETLCPE